MSAEKKICERTEGAATAVQAVHGDSFFANRVDPDPMCSTSFSVKAEPPALPCRDDDLVEKGTAVPKSCLSLLEMSSPTATGGVIPTGMTSRATRTIFDQPPLGFYSIEETSSKKASIQLALYYSSFWRNKMLAALSCRRFIETKSGQNLVFDPGGFQGRLHTCPFFGNLARVALWGGSSSGHRVVPKGVAFFGGRMTWASTCRRGTGESFTPYV